MNPIFAFHALREASRLRPLYTAAIFVVWSLPVFPYLT